MTKELNAAVEINTVPIDSIRAYENNPRRIPEAAITAVAKSIERFGWQQPIVVDTEGVIVVGHTRHLAAKSLGLTEVPVLVAALTPEKIKEYRLVDNRTGEMSGWDYNALVIELREFDQGLIDTYFADVDIEIQQLEGTQGPTQQEIDSAEKRTGTVSEAAEEALHTTTVVCPSCFHRFDVRTKSLPGMGSKAIAELTGGEAV